MQPISFSVFQSTMHVYVHKDVIRSSLQGTIQGAIRLQLDYRKVEGDWLKRKIDRSATTWLSLSR